MKGKKSSVLFVIKLGYILFDKMKEKEKEKIKKEEMMLYILKILNKNYNNI